MQSVAIRVDGLGKRYRLGELDPYRNLGEALTRSVARRLRRAERGTPTGRDYLWALDDVSFEVPRGEVLGLVGRNGAGKSTLLKILSRVTRPTRGSARLRGRVGSLLEVGTGFHPELTGRENVHLNGVILGMSRADVARRFDEIVDFAGVEQFLDTPVKRYSSGMQVRLGFAVAAHLDTEILIVDEVLAVGDAEFQRRCLGKIDDVIDSGRTVLFVSHNMGAVRRLCRRALLLEHGRVTSDGPAADVVVEYLARAAEHGVPEDWIDVAQVSRRGGGEARVVAVSYTSGVERVGYMPFPGGPLDVSLEVASDRERTVPSAAVILHDQHGTKLVNADTVTRGESIRLRPGRNVVRFRVGQLHLNPGTYVLGWWLAEPAGNRIYDFTHHGANIEVVDDSPAGLGARPLYDGVVACEFTVEVDPTP